MSIRTTRLVFVLLIALVGVVSCALWPRGGTSTIAPGGGNGTKLAQALRDGKLGAGADTGVEEEDASESAAPSASPARPLATRARGAVGEFFTKRRKELAVKAGTTKADLRVTISWNTDNTDIDLWVVEPGGEACGYSHQETKSGGKLLDDLTSGYGPERYQIVKAPKGEFVVLVKYYSANPNLIAGETHVEVVVDRLPGTSNAETRRFHVVLNAENEAYEVCKIRM